MPFPAIEQYLLKNENLPFVIDDILINFDNERAIRTLRVLSDLSQKTQVLFFTHHHHLLELALTSLNKNEVIFHNFDTDGLGVLTA